MTALIIALDAPHPVDLAKGLYKAGFRWFKLGPQSLASREAHDLIQDAKGSDVKLFLDLKLADTADTIFEAIKRFSIAGIVAVSTYTPEATIVAQEAREGDLVIWQVMYLTDTKQGIRTKQPLASGIICPGMMAKSYRNNYPFSTIIIPGVRLTSEDDFNGHLHGITCSEIANIVDFAVVGRPIWQAKDPVAAARRYADALR